MPASRKRIRPVIEEIVETPKPVAQTPEHHEHTHTHDHSHGRGRTAEEVVEAPTPQPEPFVETVHEVARYDEPVSEADKMNAEAAAKRLIGHEFEREHEYRETKTNLKLIFLVTIITALIVGFIAGGVYVYMTGVSNNVVTEESPTPAPSMTVASTPTPTPTPKPVVDLGTYSVTVLNGSGVIGAAGKVKTSVETAGFKVSTTGNAANYNFNSTVIEVKESVPSEVVTKLKESLKDYVVEEGENLSTSSKFDIVITAGKK